MPRCELCNKETDQLYEMPMCDQVEQDEDGHSHAFYSIYRVCAGCVPDDMIDNVVEITK